MDASQQVATVSAQKYSLESGGPTQGLYKAISSTSLPYNAAGLSYGTGIPGDVVVYTITTNITNASVTHTLGGASLEPRGEPIPFETENRFDPEATLDSVAVIQTGVDGLQNPATKEILTPAQNEIIVYGPTAIAYETKERPTKELALNEERMIQEGIIGLRNPLTDEIVREPQTEIIEKGVATTELTINKVDSQTNEPVSGAVFQLQHDTTGESLILPTDGSSASAFLFTALTEGRYTLTELKAPEGYLGDGYKWRVYIIKNEDGSLTVKEPVPLNHSQGSPEESEPEPTPPHVPGNVNQLITVTSASLRSAGGYDGNKNGIFENWTTSGDYFNLNVNFRIQNDATGVTAVKPGDYFTVQLDPKLIISDLNRQNIKPLDLKDSAGNLLAISSFNPESKVMTYTFTDYVQRKRDITAAFTQTLDVDARVVIDGNKTPYQFKVNVAGQALTETFEIDYGLKRTADRPVSGVISASNPDGSYQVITYVNPAGNSLANYSLFMRNYQYPSGVPSNSSGSMYNATIKIYRVPKAQNARFTDNFRPDLSKLSDVTAQFRPVLSKESNGGEMAQVNFGNAMQDGSGFVIVIDSQRTDKTKNLYVTHTLRDNGVNKIWHHYAFLSAASGSSSGASSTVEPEAPPKYPIPNIPLIPFEFEKVDESGSALNGASFKLVGVDATGKEVYTNTLTAADSSQFSFKNLVPGTYTLTELTAPNGYQLLEGAVATFTVKVTEDHKSLEIVAMEASPAFANNQVTNTKLPPTELPQTGGMGSLIFYFIGIGMIACAVKLNEPPH